VRPDLYTRRSAKLQWICEDRTRGVAGLGECMHVSLPSETSHRSARFAGVVCIC